MILTPEIQPQKDVYEYLRLIREDLLRMDTGVGEPFSALKIDGTSYLGDGGTTNYAEFETDGTLKFNGNATVWDDLRVPVSVVRLSGAQPPTEMAYQSGMVLAFPTNADKTIYFVVQMPHGWKQGSDITPHIHWTIAASGSASGAENVKWDLTYSWASIGSSFPAATSDSITIDVQNDTADDHMFDNFTAISNSETLSSILICSLTRDVSVANDYGDDAYLVEIDFHYELDTVGSRQITTK